jgi:hypothetical protein
MATNGTDAALPQALFVAAAYQQQAVEDNAESQYGYGRRIPTKDLPKRWSESFGE